MAWFSFLGFSSLVIMAVRSIWDRERRFLLYAWVPAAVFVMSDRYFARPMHEWAAKAHPKTLDLYLLSFDGSLRVQLAFTVGQYYARFSWLHNSALLAYVGLAIPMALVYTGRLIRFREGAFPSMLAFLIAGPMGFCFTTSSPHAARITCLGKLSLFIPSPSRFCPGLLCSLPRSQVGEMLCRRFI